MDIERLEYLLKHATVGEWGVYTDDDPDTPHGFEHSLHSDTYGCVGYWTGGKENHKDERWYLTKADAELLSMAKQMAAKIIELEKAIRTKELSDELKDKIDATLIRYQGDVYQASAGFDIIRWAHNGYLTRKE